MQHDTRSGERVVHYTMKTARSAPPVHGGSHQYRAPPVSSTPLTSPRMMVHSVGQPYPPPLSPKQSPSAASASAQRKLPSVTKEAPAVSSPSYFGLVLEPAADLIDSATVPRNHWSPATSSVRSFGAAIPKQMLPLDANPAYEAFRQQIDANHFGRSFSLGPLSHLGPVMTPMASSQTDPTLAVDSDGFARGGSPPAPAPLSTPPAPTHAASPVRVPWPSLPEVADHDLSRPGSSQMDVDADRNSLHDSAYVSSDSKRNSEASLDPSLFPSLTRFESPVQMDAAPDLRPQPPTPLVRADAQRFARFPMALGRLSMAAAKTGSMGVGLAPARAETAPAKMDSAQGMMDTKQLKELLDLHAAVVPSDKQPKLLLLDVRASTYYATSRIRGALNMCIPTTLLKRATFNLHKLQLTFAKEDDQAVFSSWRDASYLIVYDNDSTEKRDAVAAMNMLRKFTNEGYKGQACVLRGGFKAFEDAYPSLIDRQSPSASCAPSALSLGQAGSRRLSIAPVIGGVVLPSANASPCPFFSNIRQNMDLADGVGRIELTIPPSISVASLPAWLRDAVDPNDHGQKVADKFLRIELTEQTRMKHAYGVSSHPPKQVVILPEDDVQLSGVEKGSKNRYKDILPFEHARVHLKGKAAGDCDYVNASFLHAKRTNKRYIASQAPLPSTFADFWSMIWDEDVRVIVMLTAESEGGQIKSHPYWKNSEYGTLRLRLLSEKKVSLDVDKSRSNSTASGHVHPSTSVSEVPPASELGRRRAHTLVSVNGSECKLAVATQLQGRAPSANISNGGEAPFVIIRKFALSHREHAFAPIREITQLHYASWPDFGTPAQPSHLLALVELANAMQRASAPLNTQKATAETSAVSLPTTAQGISELDSSNSKLDRLSWLWHDEPESNPDPRPLLVHCSAGCGRTGTFCTVDTAVDLLKRQRQHATQRSNATAGLFFPNAWRDSNTGPFDGADSDVTMMDAPGKDGMSAAGAGKACEDEAWLDDDSLDLIEATVQDFRSQRISTVQTLRQYVLCYEAIAEWVSKMQERRISSSTSSGSFRGPGRTRSESMRMKLG